MKLVPIANNYMNVKSVLTRSDYQNYLRYLAVSTSTDEDVLVQKYFGNGHDYLLSCIRRAYRDFSRTMHGLGKLSTKDTLREEARNKVNLYFLELRQDRSRVTTQTIFDSWHKHTCKELSGVFQNFGHHLYIGQAQKWINMTFKYIFTLGESRISGFGELYPFCHAPIDNILIGQLIKHGFTRLSCPWSRLDDFNQYLAYQIWIRRKFSLVPLDAEFYLWLGRSLEKN